MLPSMHCIMAHTHQEDEPATLPCRAYQQVDLLNSLQSYMLTPRTPCGHASRLREQQQQQTPHLSTSTMNPVVMSYLASSRLSSLPASFDVFAQVRHHPCLYSLISVSDLCFCTFQANVVMARHLFTRRLSSMQALSNIVDCIL